MPIILRLIAAGVPAAKIIAKYGKKAYAAAKKLYKTKNKNKKIEKSLEKIPGVKIYVEAMSGPLGITTLLQVPAWMIGVKVLAQSKAEKKKEKEKKKIRTETRKAQRGIKTYSKGSIVRKPKY